MSTNVMRKELFNCSPLGPVHTLETLKGIFSSNVFSDAEQVRLTAVPSYSGVIEGGMVSVSWGGGTNQREDESNWMQSVHGITFTTKVPIQRSP